MADDNAAADISPKINTKEILAAQVKGKVKWFNVDLGYGFINREDTNDDVFVHHTAITKYNPRHQLSSLADGEEVEFDVVQGKKGQEAANVSGTSGEQVKGSRFASNLYAGRYRFRRGWNYGGGGGGGRRFFSRRYNDRDRNQENSPTPENAKEAVNEKREKTEAEINKDGVRTKKYSKTRREGRSINSEVGGDAGGRLRRSNSLPSDINRYATGNNFQQGPPRRRRRAPRGVEGRPIYRSNFGKRRGPRTISDKENIGDGNARDKHAEGIDTAHDENSKTEKGGSEYVGKGESRGKPMGRKSPEAKSEKSENTTNEKSEKSQKSTSMKYTKKRPKSNKIQDDEIAEEKSEHSPGGEEDGGHQVKEDSGDGNKENADQQKRGVGRRRGNTRGGKPRRGGGRGGGRRSSSTEASTKTPSTREGDDSKSEQGKQSHGGNGDGAEPDLVADEEIVTRQAAQVQTHDTALVGES